MTFLDKINNIYFNFMINFNYKKFIGCFIMNLESFLLEIFFNYYI